MSSKSETPSPSPSSKPVPLTEDPKPPSNQCRC
jgi:hypothetical protein